jgi:hypothetical protein
LIDGDGLNWSKQVLKLKNRIGSYLSVRFFYNSIKQIR